MDYKKIHDSLIERARDRVIEGYTEKHHIVPRCMGGSNEANNLIRLTPEEHFLVHQLLVKIYPKNHKLAFAVDMMCAGNITHGGCRTNNKRFGWLRKCIDNNEGKHWLFGHIPHYQIGSIFLNARSRGTRNRVLKR